MIYSVKLNKEIPVKIECNHYDLKMFGQFTKYVVKDGRIPVGYVDLQDIDNGVKVHYIKSSNPNLYKHFGKIADQIEVEHCLKRGIKNPYIKSVAAIGSYVAHFKRGKRFVDEGINVYLDKLISNAKPNQVIKPEFLGMQDMYMPPTLVQKYKDLIKKFPLLK